METDQTRMVTPSRYCRESIKLEVSNILNKNMEGALLTEDTAGGGNGQPGDDSPTPANI